MLTNYPCIIGIATSDASDLSINTVQNKVNFTRENTYAESRKTHILQYSISDLLGQIWPLFPKIYLVFHFMDYFSMLSLLYMYNTDEIAR